MAHDLGSGDDSDTTDGGNPAPVTSILRILMLTVLWWSAAVFVTLLLKLSAGSGGADEPNLPPFMITWLVNWMTGFICFLLGNVMFRSGALPQAVAMDRIKLLALGIVGGCEIGFLNKSLQYITISERTMIQNLNVLLMMISAQICGLEHLTGLRVVAGLLLAGGGVLQGMVSGHGGAHGADSNSPGHLLGIVFMFLSLLLTAFKWVMFQFVLQRSDSKSYLGSMSKLQFAARIQPITGAVCFVLAVVFEKEAMTRRNTWCSSELLRVPLLAVGITVICCSELKLVQVTSAVATGVLMNLHHIPMVLAGVAVFHEHVPLFSIYGFALNLVGGIIYSIARHTDRSE